MRWLVRPVAHLMESCSTDEYLSPSHFVKHTYYTDNTPLPPGPKPGQSKQKTHSGPLFKIRLQGTAHLSGKRNDKI